MKNTQADLVKAILKEIDYEGERKFNTIKEIFAARKEFSIIQKIKLDDIPRNQILRHKLMLADLNSKSPSSV